MNPMFPTSQERINAVSAYFFLGWIMLLAKKNPVFQSIFVRNHAKNATQFLVIGITLLIFIQIVIQPLLPNKAMFLTGISYGDIVFFLVFIGIFGRNLLFAYRAFQGVEAHVKNKGEYFPPHQGETYIYAGHMLHIIISCIPFLGSIFFQKETQEQNDGIRNLRKFANTIGVALIFLQVFTSGMNLSLVLVIIYGIFCINLLVKGNTQNGEYRVPSILSKIPGIQEIESGISSLPYIFFATLSVGKGQREKIDGKYWFLEILKKDESQRIPYGEFPLPIWILIIPGINLISILFLGKKYLAYRGIILQSLVFTCFFGISLWIYPNSSIHILWILPALWLLVGGKNNIHTRIPLIWQFLWILSFLGITTSELEKNIKERRQEEKSVSYNLKNEK